MNLKKKKKNNKPVPKLLISPVGLAEENVPFKKICIDFFKVILTANFRICHTGL